MADSSRCEWLVGEREMAARVRSHDWAATSLGARATWPPALGNTVTLILDHPLPMALAWGPELVTIHNDAYRRLLGKKGQILALAFPDVWGEMRDEIAEALAGRAARFEAASFMLPRDGKPQEAFFDHCFSPLRNETGAVAGILVTAVDVTDRLLAKRAKDEAVAVSQADGERRIRTATAELQASRDLLRATMDSSTDMIQVFEAVRGENGEIVDFRGVLNNHASEIRYGEVRGESLLSRDPGVVEEGIFDAFRRVTETGKPEQADRRYRHGQFDGWIYQTIVKLNDGVAATTKDISEWKTAQAEMLRLQEGAAAGRLQASEERFSSFAENSPNSLWIVDTRNREPVYLSPAFERIWGERRETLLHHPTRWLELVHPEDRERAYAAVPRAAAGEGGKFVYRIMRADDGRVRWIEDTGFPIRDASGAVTHVGGISQDVTEQREMAECLRRNQRRLWTVIEGIPQLVWRSGEGGEWTWASPQWCSYTGQTLEESRGRGWLDALHPEDRERAMAGWSEADGSSHFDMETRLFHEGEKRYRWFQTRALPVRDEDGQIVEWLGTSTDIDDLRQLQERQGVLVAELQHRTRNLLGVVRSIADRTAAHASCFEEFLPLYCERLSALSRINGLLSKLGQGERITFDELIRTELGARGFLDPDENERVMLNGPAGVRLRSATVQTFALAIHELATNAVKYGALSSGKGLLRVLWSVRRHDAEADWLHVEWLENGMGNMPPDGSAQKGYGYGRMLIEEALPYQLHARTSYELRPEGVRCTIELPLR